MIKEKNYQPHERKLVEKLSNIDTITAEDASIIISINRRMSANAPFEITEHITYKRYGARPIFVQSGRFHKDIEVIDRTKTFWTIMCIGEHTIGAPRYVISNCYS